MAVRTTAVAAQKVATAVVAYEVWALQCNKRKVLTVDSIVKRYKLDWGSYEYEGRPAMPKAGQVVRNALNAEFRRSTIAHLATTDGTDLRTKSGQIQFVYSPEQARRLKGERTWAT